MSSEAATTISNFQKGRGVLHRIPMPLSVETALLGVLGFSSEVMVEVEGEREKVLARGPRCVSLSSRSPPVSIIGISQVHGSTLFPSLISSHFNGWWRLCRGWLKVFPDGDDG